MTSSSFAGIGRVGNRWSIVPTARGWIALGVFAGITGAAAVAPSSADIALGASMFVALSGAFLSILLARRRLNGRLFATLSGPEFVPRGEPSSLTLALVGDAPPLDCRISFDPSSVRWSRRQDKPTGERARARGGIEAPPAGQRLQVRRERSPNAQFPGSAVPTMMRGAHRCRGAAIWMHDPLGLFGDRLVAFDDLIIVVHPVAHRSQLAEPVPDSRPPKDTTSVKVPMSSGGVDLLGVRPYQLGDRLSSVHWRSFATTTPLLVREFGSEEAGSGRFIIDDRAGVHRRAAFEMALDLLLGALATRSATAPPIELRSLASGHAISISTGTTPALLRWLAALEPRRLDRPGQDSLRAGWVVRPGDTVITTSTASTSLAALRQQGVQLAVVG